MRVTFLDDEPRALHENEAIAHWLAQAGQAMEVLSPNLTEVRVSVADAPPAVLGVLARHSPLISLRIFSTVHVRAISTIDETQPAHPKSESPPSEDFWPFLQSFNLTRSFEIACVAAQLSRPGCLTFDKAHSFIDGKPIEQAGEKSRLQIVDSADDLNNAWPALNQPDLIDVVKWLKAISAFSPPVARTRLQRAFAAFTYLVGHRTLESEGEMLFRAMQGLEAFYCDGVGDLRKQLSDKSQLWLGLTQSPSNLVGKLYDLRSKYVHGSAKMPYAMSIEDPEEHAPSSMKEFSSGVDLAIRLLVAALQKCAVNEVQDLHWDYAVRTVTNHGAHVGDD